MNTLEMSEYVRVSAKKWKPKEPNENPQKENTDWLGQGQNSGEREKNQWYWGWCCGAADSATACDAGIPSECQFESWMRRF